MLKQILKLESVHLLSKSEQKVITGGKKYLCDGGEVCPTGTCCNGVYCALCI